MDQAQQTTENEKTATVTVVTSTARATTTLALTLTVTRVALVETEPPAETPTETPTEPQQPPDAPVEPTEPEEPATEPPAQPQEPEITEPEPEEPETEPEEETEEEIPVVAPPTFYIPDAEQRHVLAMTLIENLVYELGREIMRAAQGREWQPIEPMEMPVEQPDAPIEEMPVGDEPPVPPVPMPSVPEIPAWRGATWEQAGVLLGNLTYELLTAAIAEAQERIAAGEVLIEPIQPDLAV